MTKKAARLTVLPRALLCTEQVGRELEPTHSVTRYAYMHIDLRDRETDDLVTHLPMCIRFIDEGRREGACAQLPLAQAVPGSALSMNA